MAERIFRRPPEITANYLLSENRRPETRNVIQEYIEAKFLQELIDALFCGDARLLASRAVGSNRIRPTRLIGAAGRGDYFKYIANHKGSKQMMVLGHYDSTIQKPEEPLEGCGGLMARGQINLEEDFAIDTAQGYVKQHIDSPDVTLQTMMSAERLTKYTDKPVLVGLWDHITYQITPIALFDRGNKRYKGIVPIEELLKPSARFRNINIMNMIEPLNLSGLISDELKQLLDNNEKLVEKIILDESFRKSQKVQNPPLVMITTSVIPFTTRYPSLAVPNTVFKVLLPYIKETGKSEVFIDSGNTEFAISQAHYPISHAFEAESGQAFFDTKTVLIETPDIKTSLNIAEELEKRKWFNEWKEKKPGKVIIAGVKSGITLEANEI